MLVASLSKILEISGRMPVPEPEPRPQCQLFSPFELQRFCSYSTCSSCAMLILSLRIRDNTHEKDCSRPIPLQPVRAPGSNSASIVQVLNQHTEATTGNILSKRIAFQKMMARYKVAAVLSRHSPECTLLGVPQEIRAAILEYLLISDCPLVPSLLPCDLTIPPTKKRCDYRISSQHTLHLDILRTCKQLYLEGNRVLTKENTVHIEIFHEHIAALGYRIPFDMPLNPAHRAFADLRRFQKFELVYVTPFLERRHQRLRRVLQKEKLDAILEDANFGVYYRYGLVSGAYDTRPFSDISGFWHVLKP